MPPSGATTEFNDVAQHALLCVGASGSSNTRSVEPQAQTAPGSGAAGSAGSAFLVAPVPVKVGRAASSGELRNGPWHHMLDACARFAQVRAATSKATISLPEGIRGMRARPYGPPQVVEGDR